MLLTGWELPHFCLPWLFSSFVLSACVPLIHCFFSSFILYMPWKRSVINANVLIVHRSKICSFLRAFGPPTVQMQINTVYAHHPSHLDKVFIVRAIFVWQFQHRRMCSLLYRGSSCKVIVRFLVELRVQCPLFPYPLMENSTPVLTLHELPDGPLVGFHGAWPESLLLLIPSRWCVRQEDYKSTWGKAYSSSWST